MITNSFRPYSRYFTCLYEVIWTASSKRL